MLIWAILLMILVFSLWTRFYYTYRIGISRIGREKLRTNSNVVIIMSIVVSILFYFSGGRIAIGNFF